ncbi:SDR family oxidoreductase [Shimia sp. NS0008-38b]|uniref:SDR family NAD(P)-dependent oxidoreductase n=1 Tax=Shimia sp. NS0008-38b TaxID=3127653 RepID=UPI003107FB38
MRALVIGDSGGIGEAVADQARVRGDEVVGLSRRRDGLEFAAPETVERVLSGISGPFDMVFVATGALSSTDVRPEKALRELTAAEMAAQFAVNTIGPALVMKQLGRWLPRQSRSVFAVLSARVGSIGDNRAGGWYSYRSSKAALNQVLHTGAIEVARTHKHAICVALHPGTVETDFTASYPAHKKVGPREAAENLLSVLEALTPQESGGFFDYSGARVPW